jgi:hypothetical protein
VNRRGAYNQDNGGAFGVTAAAELQWQIPNDTTAQGYFLGAQCGLCNNSQWRVKSRSLR